MKSSNFAAKVNPQAKHAARHALPAGDGGVALAPPAYGIDFVDHGSAAPVQRAPAPKAEEELKPPVQGKFDGASAQPGSEAPPNRTGMPDRLKAGIESLSGFDMSDVKVHVNSDKPAQLDALAYAQGNDIHLAPGQEKHLPHEAWHVVQQRQGRVQATIQAKGVPINDDQSLEREADLMGARANAIPPFQLACRECGDRRDDERMPSSQVVQGVIQRVTECNESDHYSDPIGLWIQEQYVADVSGSGEKEYAVKAADNSWNYVDIADEPYGEVYEIKSSNIGAAQAAAEAGYYRDRLNARCESGRDNGRWVLGEKFDDVWDGTFGNHDYQAWCPRKGAIIYQEV